MISAKNLVIIQIKSLIWLWGSQILHQALSTTPDFEPCIVVVFQIDLKRNEILLEYQTAKIDKSFSIALEMHFGECPAQMNNGWKTAPPQISA